MLATAWPFIELDDRGVPLIQGTRIKVLLLIEEHQAYRWDAEQIQRQHPQLTLPQIHAALGYYYEHQDECDRLIEAGQILADELRKKRENPELQVRLKRLKEGT